MFRGLICQKKNHPRFAAKMEQKKIMKFDEVCRAEASRLPMNAHNESKI
jgi:hypothetical protein